MTEQEYTSPIASFDVKIETEKTQTVPIMEEGRGALEKINAEKGLGFDDFDLDYYTKLFKVSELNEYGYGYGYGFEYLRYLKVS